MIKFTLSSDDLIQSTEKAPCGTACSFRLYLAERYVLLDLRDVSVQRVVGPCMDLEALGISVLIQKEPCRQDGPCLPPISLAVACCWLPWLARPPWRRSVSSQFREQLYFAFYTLHPICYLKKKIVQARVIKGMFLKPKGLNALG